MTPKMDIIEYIDNKIEKFGDSVDKRFDKMESKLDLLVQFRSRVLGIIVGITTIFSLIFNIILFVFKR